jgi:ribose transport system substrate-binding protein
MVRSAVVGLAVLAGCSGGSSEPEKGTTDAGTGPARPKANARVTPAVKPVTGPIKLLFITNSNADWWNAVEKGMQDGGKEAGVTVEMRRNEGTTEGQIDRLKEALSLDVQGVAVSVIEAEAPGVADAMRALQDAGKVVITIDSDIEARSADARSAYIGTDNIKAGLAAGKAAAALKPAGGKVATFVGTSGAANARERKKGFFQAAGPQFKDVETLDDNSEFARARDNVQTALTKYGDLDMMLGLWSYNAWNISEEVAKNAEARKRITVVTFDLDEASVGELAAGHIDVSVCQNPYDMGFFGVKCLKAILQGDEKALKEVLPDGKTRETGVRVIVPKKDSPVKGENVIDIDEMKSWLASKGLKSS